MGRGNASCLSGTEPERGNDLHMLSAVGLKVELNLWDWLEEAQPQAIFSKTFTSLHDSGMFGRNSKGLVFTELPGNDLVN